MKTILIEAIRPIANCPYNKSTDLKNALKFWIDTGEVIFVEAISNANHVHTDFVSRYIQFYQGGTTESPRMMGLFGHTVAEGFSVFADSVDGVYNMPIATKNKVEQMLAKENGYSLTVKKKSATSVKITASAPASKKIRVSVLLVDADHSFKQIFAQKDVTISTKAKTITLSGVPAYADCSYVVMLQDIKDYAPDLVNNSTVGHYEKEVFAVAVAN